MTYPNCIDKITIPMFAMSDALGDQIVGFSPGQSVRVWSSNNKEMEQQVNKRYGNFNADYCYIFKVVLLNTCSTY